MKEGFSSEIINVPFLFVDHNQIDAPTWETMEINVKANTLTKLPPG